MGYCSTGYLLLLLNVSFAVATASLRGQQLLRALTPRPFDCSVPMCRRLASRVPGRAVLGLPRYPWSPSVWGKMRILLGLRASPRPRVGCG